MADIKDIPVPDIGDFDGVEVIEILVAAGDSIAVEDPIASLESDKAAMEIPSPFAGTVKEVKINLGDKVSEGDLLITIEASADTSADKAATEKPVEKAPAEETKAAPAPVKQPAAPKPSPTPSPRPSPTASIPRNLTR